MRKIWFSGHSFFFFVLLLRKQRSRLDSQNVLGAVSEFRKFFLIFIPHHFSTLASFSFPGNVQEMKSQFGYCEQPKNHLPFLLRRRITSPGLSRAAGSGDARHLGHFMLSGVSGIFLVNLQSGKPEQAINLPNRPRFISKSFPHSRHCSPVFSSVFWDFTVSYFSSKCFAKGS